MNRFLKAAAILVVAMFVLLTAVHHNVATASVSLPDPLVDEHLAAKRGSQTIVVAGGCFWGIQTVFKHVKGVTRSTSGYAGGTVKNPGYEQVSTGTTGHAESVEIVYDPSQITLGTILKVFFSVAHDPTEVNRQGPDVGTQYRSAIFFANADQQRIAQAYVDQLNRAKVFPRTIATQIVPLAGFYRAEDYHQDYAEKNPDNPYIQICDLPKLKNLQQDFPALYVARP